MAKLIASPTAANAANAAAATPPPKYLAPRISEEVHWETRQHLQLLYQKIGELTQAITIQQQALDKLKGGGGGK